jgi:outer membrane receptor for ferrienterochelin and colicins
MLKVHLALSSAMTLALAAMAASGAQAEDAGPTEVESVVVTASSIAQRIQDAPASVSVVSAENLQQRPIQDIVDALGRVEGVTLSRAGNQRTIQLRGLSSAYTLLMIDGKRVSSTNNMFRGNDYDAGWAPIEAIERVEVVRGPMSSLYGSDAIGGAVNIITKPVGKTWTGSVSADYTAQEHSQAGDSYKGGFYVSGPLVVDTLGLKVWGGYDRRDPDKGVNSSGLAGMPLQQETFINGTLEWTPDEATDVTAQYGFSRSNHDHFIMKRQDFALTHKREWDFGESRLRFYGDRVENLTGNTTGEINPNTARNYALDARFTAPLGDNSLTVGAEHRWQDLDDPKLLAGWPGSPTAGKDTEASVKQWALFAENEWRITDDLRLTVGDRYDHHENFGGHHSPRAYLVYHLTPNISLRGGWSRAFRAPTLLQNSPNWGSVSCGSATTGCFIVGSTELKPETAESFEGGVRFDFDRWSGGITAFQNELKDMISISNRTRDPVLAPNYPNFVGYLADGRPVFRYENIAKVRSKGVETSIAGDITETLSIRANYTYLKSEDRSSANPIPLIYQPKHSANLTLDWRAMENLSLYASANYIGRQYIAAYANPAFNEIQEAYTLVDIGGRYDVNERLTVRAGVLNLADKRIERTTSTEYNEDGRRFFLSLTHRF